MPRKSTTEEFIEKAKLLHISEITNEPKYDYSLVEYINNKTKVKIICQIEGHGEFMQKPKDHLNGNRCPKCHKQNIPLTQQEFIERAEKIHIDINGNIKYDYSLAKYVDAITKVKIICLKEGHGEFLQTPNHHLAGQGCKICGINIRTMSTEEFIKKATDVHCNKYDYSLVEYIDTITKVKIICPKEGHGEFLQTPNSHLSESGCVICGIEEHLKKTTKTLQNFIKDAQKSHGYIYDYSLVEYINNNTKVKIICHKHGVFEQIPDSHIRDKGCPVCRESKGERKIKTFLIVNDINFNKQHKFNDCKNINPLPFDFYLPEHNLCIEYDGEHHYKSVRFNGKSIESSEKAFKKTQLHDQIKTDYCLNNNIQLLRIPYWDFKNIEQILEKELQIAHVEN